MFYTYNEVQEFLTQYYQTYHYKLDFLEAVTLLKYEKEPHQNLQFPDFYSWDCESEETLKELLNQIPVYSEMGTMAFRKKSQKRCDNNLLIEPSLEIGIIQETYNNRCQMRYENQYKLLYVVKGCFRIKIWDREHYICQNQFCFISPMVLHMQMIEADSIILLLGISETILKNNLIPFLHFHHELTEFMKQTAIYGKKGYIVLEGDCNRDVRECYRMLLANSYKFDEYHTNKMILSSAMLCTEIVQSCSGKIYYENGKKYSENTFIQDILEYIEEYAAEVTLDSISRQFSYEKTYISKLIKKNTGKNFSVLVRELRINRAKELIKFTELALEKIGEMVGYSSRSNFYRAFCICTGMSPLQYRDACKGKKEEDFCKK